MADYYNFDIEAFVKMADKHGNKWRELVICPVLKVLNHEFREVLDCLYGKHLDFKTLLIARKIEYNEAYVKFAHIAGLDDAYRYAGHCYNRITNIGPLVPDNQYEYLRSTLRSPFPDVQADMNA